MAMNWGYNKESSQPCASSSRCSTPAWPVTSKASWNPGTQGNCPRSFGRGGFLKSLAMRERPWEWSLTSREKFHVPELFSSCAAGISFFTASKTISPWALNYILLYAKPLFMSGSVKWGIQFRIAPARHYTWVHSFKLLTKDGLLHPISDGSLCNKYHQTHFKRALESKSIFEMREIVHTVAVVTGQSEIKVIAPQPNIRLP